MKKTSNNTLLLFAFIALIVLGFSGNSIAAQKEAHPEEASCITSKCHASMEKQKYIISITHKK